MGFLFNYVDNCSENVWCWKTKWLLISIDLVLFGFLASYFNDFLIETESNNINIIYGQSKAFDILNYKGYSVLFIYLMDITVTLDDNETLFYSKLLFSQK